MPSVTVTVYGDAPPVTATLKLLDEPAQIVASPLNTDAVGGVVGFSGCKADTVFTRQLPQAAWPFTAPPLLIDVVVKDPFIYPITAAVTSNVKPKSLLGTQEVVVATLNVPTTTPGPEGIVGAVALVKIPVPEEKFSLRVATV